MNKTLRTLSVAAVAAFTVFGAQADEADASQYAAQFDTQRTRAEVQAEAAKVAAARSTEPAGSRVVSHPSSANRDAVRAEAAAAARAGVLARGEFGMM